MKSGYGFEGLFWFVEMAIAVFVWNLCQKYFGCEGWALRSEKKGGEVYHKALQGFARLHAVSVRLITRWSKNIF